MASHGCNSTDPKPTLPWGHMVVPDTVSLVLMSTQCAWAALKVAGKWLNATVALVKGGRRLLLSARVPGNVTTVTASRMGWGPIPMLSAYDTESDAPVLPWDRVL